ncbi:flagellar biosynthesis regulator FlaF [Roseovarius ramblicola]|uniref:Flagellar biosynthesis regulator FlaF n=1 Tax=Roseovarius ramblicola TaxID=2022336 RepID=A0ABV5HXE9_9RHOB
MNTTLQARAAYGAEAGAVHTPRATEYRAFARITHRLKSATAADGGPGGGRDMPALAAALHDNRRLWAILAADAADPANRLPPALRARLVYLAEFTRVHSGRVLREGASTEPLIEVNVAVMRGLAGTGGTA